MLDTLTAELAKSAPTKIQLICGGVSGMVGTAITYLFGGWTTAIEALVMAMVIDYLTGVMAAYINPKKKLNSHVGFAGILKKVMILSIVAFSHFIDNCTGQNVVCLAVTWFFIGNEGLSILENAAKAGLPVPEKLRATLEQLHDGGAKDAK